MTSFEFIPLTILMAIPLVAVIGGIIGAIVKNHNRQRLLELAQKERIAAIQQGIDPERLKPLVAEKPNGLSFAQKQLRRAQGMMIGGLCAVGFGIAMSCMITFLDREPGGWAVGLIFALPGAALLISARVVKPPPEDVREAYQEGAPEPSA